ncbi:stage III sporulation protein AG [Cohnella faecalis]|uniref:Stage III sporulation protein AG n=1 Tax=Cohnella faecalis TaxID=2315694 RepID=A0A398CFQ2_9BACL|nr:stage III sporulation protein AG [Cohnella faecalis]RIE00732.1 stage III sporulation protein AG [Cohnella faecalis]
MAKWLQKLETFIGGGPGGARRVRAFRWLVLIGLIGAALLLAASLLNVKTVDPSKQPDYSPYRDEDVPKQQEAFIGGGESGKDDPFTDIEAQLETRLKEMLETMVGVGSSDVMVTVESTEETVVQLNEKTTSQITEETDRNGAKRHITDVTRDGQVVLYEVSSGSKSPIIVKKLKPKVRGVIIVAKGAENATVHRLIAEAVSRGLDVPIHRISVVPRKS